MPIDTGEGKISFLEKTLPKKKIKKSIYLNRAELNQVLASYLRSVADINEEDNIFVNVDIVCSSGGFSRPTATIKGVTISN